jgi:branched-chain amino acid transport system ATP-binding protein
VITGVFPPSGGDIFFRGEDISGKKPHQVYRKRIGRTFQTKSLFENLSVLDNLIASQIYHSRSGLWDGIWQTQREKNDEMRLHEKACNIAEFVGLERMLEKLGKNLAIEQRSRLSIGIALAGDPILILLDEPMAGLNLEEIDKILALIREIRKQGITVCLIEHKMNAVMNISDRIIVLNYGEKIAEGKPGQIVENPAVMKAYLGEKYAPQSR